MTDRPIIFSAPMVRALLAGRKTMTRRLAWAFRDVNDNHTKTASPWLNAAVGDRLWVRESHHALGSWDCSGKAPRFVWANFNGHEVKFDGAARSSPRSSKVAWWTRPAIHMPRSASRLTLVVTATKIERVQRISNVDAIAEGCGVNFDYEHPERTRETFPAERFRDLWARLHGMESWNANPEVVALTFKIYQQNIDSMEKAA